MVRNDNAINAGETGYMLPYGVWETMPPPGGGLSKPNTSRLYDMRAIHRSSR